MARPTQWVHEALTGSTTGTAGAAQGITVFTMGDGNIIEGPATLIRMRGRIHFFSANQLWIHWCLIFNPGGRFAAGDYDALDSGLSNERSISNILAHGIGYFDGTDDSYHIDELIDNKAMRKMMPGDTITIIWVGSAASAHVYGWNIKFLFKPL